MTQLTPQEIADDLIVQINFAMLERRDVLKRAGVSRATLSRWLRNLSTPRRSTIIALQVAIQQLSSEMGANESRD